MSPALIGIIALVASLLGNVWLWNEKEAEHDRATSLNTQLATANKATKACNDSIAGLEKAARKQGAQAERARIEAAERRKKRNEQADRELSTPATVPGDDCKSAQDRVKRILSARKAAP